MARLYPVVLCGGSGTRLWPLSRKSYPKQFLPVLGEQTLFQQSVLRLCGTDFAPPLVITASDFRFIVTEQLAAIGVEAGDILIEPEARNTGPAILAAALHLEQHHPGAILLAAPSDHVLPDTQAFHAAVQAGLPAVAAGQLVTFGIKPDRPETGYGYLELEATPASGAAPLRRFVEKPDAATAARMLATGRFLWNAGIFLMAATDVIEAFRLHAPEIFAPVAAAVTGATPDLGFLRLAPAPWQQVPATSIDYAVMEKADNLAVMPYAGIWSDLGAWDSVMEASRQDANGVALSGPTLAVACENTLLRAETGTQQLVGLGLKNIAAIAMEDAVLVADMTAAQSVKQVVDLLRSEGVPQAETFPRDHRPWGWFDRLVSHQDFQVKRILVHPGAALSLQSHVHRAEHWIVVRGTARVTIGTKTSTLGENQSVYVPQGARHRLENPGSDPLVLIEVQTGAYLGEDDITRYEDRYARE